MMKFRDKPYSYELISWYASGSKKLPPVKSMSWVGKIATAKVIRGLCISKLVIVPKPAPGQTNDDPGYGLGCASMH